jgi:integrase/recombinase XerD
MNACNYRRSGNPEFSILSQRDKLAIALLVGAGLRRAEAVNLTFDSVIEQPTEGNGSRTLLNVTGKGAKDRAIPISESIADKIRQWGERVNYEGYILRSVGRDKNIGEGISATSLYNLIQKRGELAGIANLQPHDLRRTYAQIGYNAGVSVAQISLLLGHEDIKTTMRYLNVELDTSVTISDFIPV